MSKKRKDKESMICLTPKINQRFFVYCIQIKEKLFFFCFASFFAEKQFPKEKGEWRMNKKEKDFFLTALSTVIKKDPSMSIRKHVNELKVTKKPWGHQLN